MCLPQRVSSDIPLLVLNSTSVMKSLIELSRWDLWAITGVRAGFFDRHSTSAGRPKTRIGLLDTGTTFMDIDSTLCIIWIYSRVSHIACDHRPKYWIPSNVQRTLSRSENPSSRYQHRKLSLEWNEFCSRWRCRISIYLSSIRSEVRCASTMSWSWPYQGTQA